jgi:Domain of unknown function (DUF4349)
MRLTDEQIGAELRALREKPKSDFAASLDQRVATGFHTERTPRAGKRDLTWGRLGLVLAPLAAAAVVVVVIANNDTGPGGEDSGGTSFSAPPATEIQPDSAPRQSVAPDTAVPPLATPPPNGSRPRNDRTQIQELSASLGLSTEKDELQAAADGVVEVTDRYDGFVDSSDVRVGGRQSHASFSLRIPATDLRDALDDLSELGRVTLRDEGSVNVTGAYVDTGKAYREARAKVDTLLAQLRTADSPDEAAAIRKQLVPARQELAAARAALRGVKQRVTYAPVAVQIRADGDGSWSIGDAADDAAGILEAIAGAVLIALAVLIPLAALLILGWLGAREFGRRRREATLDRS